MTRSEAHVAAATLACLRNMTTARLRALVRTWPDPRVALDAVQRGHAHEALLRIQTRPGIAHALAQRWANVQPGPIEALLERRGTYVWLDTDPDAPIRDDIPDRPYVLFGEGERPDALARDRIAIVGTRSASPSGLSDAHLLGATVAAADATVVSGLAIGIDAAAHRGALTTGTTIAVVATGLDVVYPRRHAALAQQIRASGMLVSETAFGVGPASYRFPIRNRIIAGLAQAVVVVEATLTGGARITAELANDYGRTVYAVPGSRRNPAALGTNALIADGAIPLLAPSDLWVGLGHRAPANVDAAWGTPASGTRPTSRSPEADAVLRSFDGAGASLDQLVERTGLPIATVATALRSLSDVAAVIERRGQWWLA